MAKQLPYSTMVEIFRRFRAAEPEPKGELEHVNAYTLVVAVALSAQATDAGVNKATRALFQVADTPQKMLDLGEERLIEHIKTIGLFRNKAKNVMKLSRILVEEYGGEVPSSRAALQSLPGVGRKTANVVLNMWWGPRAGGRHPYLPRRQPRGHRARQGRRRRRARHRGQCPRRVPAPRPSLADPAWPLHLRGAQAQMPRLPDPRSLRLRGQDAGAPGQNPRKRTPA
jgi:hypothetical protein